MATKRNEPAIGTTPTDPDDDTIHLQVKVGGTARYQGKAFGDRGTIQVRRGDRGQVDGPVEEVDPNEVPDVSTRPVPKAA